MATKIFKPFYIVDYYYGSIEKMNIKFKRVTFKDPDLLKARREAIEYATKPWRDIQNDKYDGPRLEKILNKIINIISVRASFCPNKDEQIVIYGDDEHTVLTGLDAEAEYYLDHDLIEEDNLIEIYENEKDEDEDEVNPTFQLAKDYLEKEPDFDYYIVHVISEDLEEIFPELKLDGYLNAQSA